MIFGSTMGLREDFEAVYDLMVSGMIVPVVDAISDALSNRYVFRARTAEYHTSWVRRAHLAHQPRKRTEFRGLRRPESMSHDPCVTPTSSWLRQDAERFIGVRAASFIPRLTL